MGYVVNKRDRWYAVSYEGIDPVTGRDRRRWHPAADEVSARSIAEYLPAARGSAAHGMTLGRFIRTRWLPARQDRLRPTTFHRYGQMTELYVLPHLGRVPLRRLTIAHLQDLYAELRTSGSHDGRPLAPKTVLNAHQVLRTALGDAHRQGLVARNVASMMDSPCHGSAPEQSCWNQEELRAFLHAAAAHRLTLALWLYATRRCSRTPCQTSQAPPISANAASTNNSSDRTTDTASTYEPPLRRMSKSAWRRGWLAGADDRRAGVGVHAVRFDDLDVGQAGSVEELRVIALGECPGDAAGPLLDIGSPARQRLPS